MVCHHLDLIPSHLPLKRFKIVQACEAPRLVVWLAAGQLLVLIDGAGTREPLCSGHLAATETRARHCHFRIKSSIVKGFEAVETIKVTIL
jgi:hypothetical protein